MRGLAYAVDEEKIAKDFAAAGEVEEVKLLKNSEGGSRETTLSRALVAFMFSCLFLVTRGTRPCLRGRSRGIAFVTFKTKKGLSKLIDEWNEQESAGGRVVTFAHVPSGDVSIGLPHIAALA